MHKIGAVDMEKSDVLYSAEQIQIPPDLAEIIKKFTKTVIRTKPNDLVKWSANYFAKEAGREEIPFPNVPLESREELAARYVEHIELLQEHDFDTDDVKLLLDVFQKKAMNDVLNKDGFEAAINEVFEPIVEDVAPFLNAFVKLFNVFDADNSGRVDFQEFVSGLSLLLLGDEKERISLVYEMVDKNKDGKITLDELLSFFRGYVPGTWKPLGLLYTEDQWRSDKVKVTDMFKEIDLDSNGNISYDEFFTACVGGEHPLLLSLTGLAKQLHEVGDEGDDIEAEIAPAVMCLNEDFDEKMMGEMVKGMEQAMEQLTTQMADGEGGCQVQ